MIPRNMLPVLPKWCETPQVNMRQFEIKDYHQCSIIDLHLKTHSTFPDPL